MTLRASDPMQALIVGAAALVAVCGYALFAPWVADDALIALRYARNTIDAAEMVYNLGEPIMAFTSPAQIAILAMLYGAAGTHVMGVYKLVCLAVTALAIIGSARATPRGPGRTLVLAILLSSTPVLLWTMGGMETPLLFALVAWLTILALDPTPGARSLILLHVVAGLAFLVRHDSVLFAAPVVLVAWFRAQSWRAVLAALPVGAMVPLAWLAFAAAYYGWIFPTSAVKFGAVNPRAVFDNALYTAFWLCIVGLLPALLLAWWRGGSGPIRGFVQRNPGIAVGLALVGAYQLLVATAHMMFSWRAFEPFLPAAAIAVGHIVAEVRSAVSAGGARKITALLTAVVAVQAASLAYTYLHSANGLSPVGEFRDGGIRDGIRHFMPAASASAPEIRKHWAQLGRSRPPTLYTLMGGALPVALPEAHVYEPLTSYRRGCFVHMNELFRHADYVQTFSTWPMSDEARKQGFARITSHPFLDGITIDVYHNPGGRPRAMAARINQPCPPA